VRGKGLSGRDAGRGPGPGGGPVDGGPVGGGPVGVGPARWAPSGGPRARTWREPAGAPACRPRGGGARATVEARGGARRPQPLGRDRPGTRSREASEPRACGAGRDRTGRRASRPQGERGARARKAAGGRKLPERYLCDPRSGGAARSARLVQGDARAAERAAAAASWPPAASWRRPQRAGPAAARRRSAPTQPLRGVRPNRAAWQRQHRGTLPACPPIASQVTARGAGRPRDLRPFAKLPTRGGVQSPVLGLRMRPNRGALPVCPPVASLRGRPHRASLRGASAKGDIAGMSPHSVALGARRRAPLRPVPSRPKPPRPVPSRPAQPAAPCRVRLSGPVCAWVRSQSPSSALDMEPAATSMRVPSGLGPRALRLHKRAAAISNERLILAQGPP
jgi:hypothetical protein